jgi:DNA primase
MPPAHSEVVSEYVTQRKRGVNKIGYGPFQTKKKTPSFTFAGE